MLTESRRASSVRSPDRLETNGFKRTGGTARLVTGDPSVSLRLRETKKKNPRFANRKVGEVKSQYGLSDSRRTGAKIGKAFR